jgi:hypothetical protein
MHLMMVKRQTKLRKFIGQIALNRWPKKLDHYTASLSRELPIASKSSIVCSLTKVIPPEYLLLTVRYIPTTPNIVDTDIPRIAQITSDVTIYSI